MYEIWFATVAELIDEIKDRKAGTDLTADDKELLSRVESAAEWLEWNIRRALEKEMERIGD